MFVPGRIRVIFTNYDVALLYTCDYETEDGRCFAGQTSVDILSRSRNPDQDLKYPLLRRVKDLCEDPKDMVDVDHSTGMIYNRTIVKLGLTVFLLNHTVLATSIKRP